MQSTQSTQSFTTSSTICSNEFKSICINKGFMVLEEKYLKHFINLK